MSRHRRLRQNLGRDKHYRGESLATNPDVVVDAEHKANRVGDEDNAGPSERLLDDEFSSIDYPVLDIKETEVDEFLSQLYLRVLFDSSATPSQEFASDEPLWQTRYRHMFAKVFGGAGVHFKLLPKFRAAVQNLCK